MLFDSPWFAGGSFFVFLQRYTFPLVKYFPVGYNVQ